VRHAAYRAVGPVFAWARRDERDADGNDQHHHSIACGNSLGT
jgi:hypothetical protein